MRKNVKTECILKIKCEKKKINDEINFKILFAKNTNYKSYC